MDRCFWGTEKFLVAYFDGIEEIGIDFESNFLEYILWI